MDHRSIKRIYALYSDVYDAIFKRFFYPRISHALKVMEIKPDQRVLDVGVGTGLSLSLYPAHAKVVGIDLSAEMLKKARHKVSCEGLCHINLIEMDGMNLSFKDDSFDKVFISHFVSVVPDPYKAMREVKRVCKKGGDVVIVNHFRSTNRLMAVLERVFNPLTKRIGWRCDMSLDEFIKGAALRVKKQYKLKKLDLWHLIFATNEK
ncbi:MAG: class I SAM-dependent methyltransferase [Deltaproteobacteria bacterium]|nr:class I SAM-dependent methyltransferase [Deltaproteobacteria bacterium]